jgi:hypothetical protein
MPTDFASFCMLSLRVFCLLSSLVCADTHGVGVAPLSKPTTSSRFGVAVDPAYAEGAAFLKALGITQARNKSRLWQQTGERGPLNDWLSPRAAGKNTSYNVEAELGADTSEA